MGCAKSSPRKVNGDPSFTLTCADQAEKIKDQPAGGKIEPKNIIDPNAPFSFRTVHSAVRWNKPSPEVELLLNSQEAVDCVDSANGNRPIHIAAQNGHYELVELIIRKNADINAKNMKGNSALHMAIGYDYYSTAKLIIKAGGDLEMVNDMGVAAKYGLEGDKALGIAALASATTFNEVMEGFDLIETVLEKVNKVSFAQAGLKAKKALGADWTPELQDRFKSITSRL
jgi:hypothetical protein